MKANDCRICTKEFTYNKGFQLTCCPECSEEQKAILYRWKKELAKRERAKAPKKKKEPKPKKKKIKSLSEVASEARKAGMNYGEYIARTEGGMK